MENSKPRILIISSANPTVGPGVVAQNSYQIFKKNGFEVDLLTKYKVTDFPEYISVYDTNEYSLIERTKKRINKWCRNLRIKQKTGFHFFYRRETVPPIPVFRVLSRIKKQYDVVYIFFWQGMLSYKTVEAIYDKLHCQIHFRGVDYSHMSGGCHFTGDCEKYKTGCGACPAIYSNNNNDFTAFNVKYREKVLKKVHPIVCGNNYMQTFYKQSYLYKNYDRLERTYALIDHQKYYPMEKSLLRKRYSISESKTFILFFAAQNLDNERKGISFLLASISLFYERLTLDERKSILILLAGKNIDSIKDKLLFEYKYLGYLSVDELPNIYSLADVFLSPSVNDAGPLMLYQSISCGTPVVSFEMGAAIDAIKDKGTGYCAKLKDANDFANGIEYIYRLSATDYTLMRETCHKVALELTSESAYIKRFTILYNKFKP